MKKNKKLIINISIFLIIIIIIILIYYVIYLPNKKYTNKDFKIITYKSKVDMDNDGIDDQTDILNNVKKYLKSKPKYESKYYYTGYPNDGYGVCTDVVAFGLLDAGYDLMELVNKDIKDNRFMYNVYKINKNIDFRRVRNLIIYFRNNSINLTTNIYDIDKWQAGDIVVFSHHIGIISEHRNNKGISYMYHLSKPKQKNYEVDVLEKNKDDIVGHFRIS